jgi:hypothetical protein
MKNLNRIKKYEEWLFEEGNAQMGNTTIDNPGGYTYNPVGEEEDESNYMFFSNLKRIKELADMILKFDQKSVDDMLNNGHDWANTHVNTAKTNLDHVFEFFNSELKGISESHKVSDFERKYAMDPVWWAAWREENEKEKKLDISKDAFSKTYEIKDDKGKFLFVFDYGRSSLFTNLPARYFQLKDERSQKDMEELEATADKIRGIEAPKADDKKEKKDDPLGGLGI